VSEVRQRLDVPDPTHEFPIFDELRARGATDYIALKRFFLRTDHAAIVHPGKGAEGMTISVTTDAAGGFSDPQLDGIRNMLQPLCLTLKSGANRAMAEDITAAYLGKDASVRVLSGDIQRGSTETLSAVVWYLDLANFTKMSEEHGGEAMIELLNDYFGEVVDLLEDTGGNVLKFMGDGLLAIYDLNEVEDARAIAVASASKLQGIFDQINARREAEGKPVTDFTLALHAGDVLYGNIGGKSRLDFTVIGPAVNTTARILGMSGPLDEKIVISSAVAAPLRTTNPDLVSLGQYRLRGVTERQEIFTLDQGST
ncbi:MAG: adenylate/guanylate cyclase domain-containing protein, partial [Pseudomonadota bacterium]